METLERLAEMAKHRLTDINKPNVVFVGYDGIVWRTPNNGNPRQAISRGAFPGNRKTVERGEFWEN